MAASPDHPQLQFIQAKGYTKGRPDGPPLWVVVHDMEASETPTRAESTAIYFADPPDGRNVSSHYCADENSIVQCVRLADSAWTVGNRPGNNRGINWELAGFAAQSREQWLDDYGRAMIDQIAPIILADMDEFGIPLHRCTIADLIARRPGITSHNDLRVAFGGTTHTDPGANFPWDYLFDVLAGGGGMANGLLFCKRGDNSPDVACLQHFLNQTEPAVPGQPSNQIPEDGIYGAPTAAKLSRVLATVGWNVSGDNFLRGELEALHRAHILATVRANPTPPAPPGAHRHSIEAGQTGGAEPI